ncbi:MAG: hypothetical protein ACREGR_04670 [Minisyncoccia bacterium]
MMNKTRPTCQKVHKLTIRRPIRCNHRIEDGNVCRTLLPSGLTVYARIEAGVDPSRLTEQANLYECDSTGQSTGTTYLGVPYSSFQFTDS